MRKEEKDFSFEYVVGIDEVGLGAIAGPVVAVALMFDKDTLEYLRTLTYQPKRKIYHITDSKQLPPEIREYFREKILQLYKAIGYGVVTVDELNTIKNISIGGAIARSRALTDLLRWTEVKPDLVLVDGPASFAEELKKLNLRGINIKAIVKGDQKYISISAASIVAKTFRDNIMKQLAEETEFKSWKDNVGYRSKEHYQEIKKFGLSKYHRAYLIKEGR